MKSIVFFNNKGGVGKTTLTCNVVSYLNQNKNKRVLLIDADPQCNATQAILTEKECEDLYLNGSSNDQTLFDYLGPLEEGESEISCPIKPILGTSNKFGTDLIPGHPKMSLVEDKLSAAWSEMQGSTPAGYRVTNWPEQLYKNISSSYDLVVFDVGPSLGALNRTVILASDFMVTPFGCDIFSLLGIQNISSWIEAWSKQYKRAVQVLKDDRPDTLTKYPIISDIDNKFRFAGYSVQQYVTRSFKDGKRPVKAYDQIMQDIPGTVEEYLSLFNSPGIEKDKLDLGHIPFLYSLIPLSQAEKCPIHALKDTKRLVGSQYQQVKDYSDLLDSFCNKLLENVESKP